MAVGRGRSEREAEAFPAVRRRLERSENEARSHFPVSYTHLGRRDAPRVALALLERGVKADLIVSSTAVLSLSLIHI